jgi:hypothetical protein
VATPVQRPVRRGRVGLRQQARAHRRSPPSPYRRRSPGGRPYWPSTRHRARASPRQFCCSWRPMRHNERGSSPTARAPPASRFIAVALELSKKVRSRSVRDRPEGRRRRGRELGERPSCSSHLRRGARLRCRSPGPQAFSRSQVSDDIVRKLDVVADLFRACPSHNFDQVTPPSATSLLSACSEGRAWSGLPVERPLINAQGLSY